MYHFRHEIERLFFDAFGHVQNDLLGCQESRGQADLFGPFGRGQLVGTWEGTVSMTISAPSTARCKSVSMAIVSGSFIPGRYLGFSRIRCICLAKPD